MNNKLYDKLIFELSRPGRRGYSLPDNGYPEVTLPDNLLRKSDIGLPEADELTVVRHYTNMSTNNFGVDTGFNQRGDGVRPRDCIAASRYSRTFQPGCPCHVSYTCVGARRNRRNG